MYFNVKKHDFFADFLHLLPREIANGIACVLFQKETRVNKIQYVCFFFLFYDNE